MSSKLFLQDIILSKPNQKGKKVKIKILIGPLAGKEFEANKVQEKNVSCYHVNDDNIKTYFLQKDIIEI